jgi:hypothetical protein
MDIATILQLGSILKLEKLFHFLIRANKNGLTILFWSTDGLKIIGVTDLGRATCNRLDLNDDRHNEGSIIKARRLWVSGGWHPPAEDSRLK